MTSTNENLKKLQKEIKAYDLPELMYDVYCDRVNFVGDRKVIRQFFERRGIMTDTDRAGFSITLNDAASFGLPMVAKCYLIPSDARKKPTAL